MVSSRVEHEVEEKADPELACGEQKKKKKTQKGKISANASSLEVNPSENLIEPTDDMKGVIHTQKKKKRKHSDSQKPNDTDTVQDGENKAESSHSKSNFQKSKSSKRVKKAIESTNSVNQSDIPQETPKKVRFALKKNMGKS